MSRNQMLILIILEFMDTISDLSFRGPNSLWRPNIFHSKMWTLTSKWKLNGTKKLMVDWSHCWRLLQELSFMNQPSSLSLQANTLQKIRAYLSGLMKPSLETSLKPWGLLSSSSRWWNSTRWSWDPSGEPSCQDSMTTKRLQHLKQPFHSSKHGS